MINLSKHQHHSLTRGVTLFEILAVIGLVVIVALVINFLVVIVHFIGKTW